MSRPGHIALYLVCLAVAARTLLDVGDPSLRWWYVGLQAAFLVLYSLCWWRRLPLPVRVLCIVAQGTLILLVLSLEPQADFVTALFAVLAYQSMIVLPVRLRAVAVAACIVLTAVSLMAYLGPLRGLALALLPMAAALVLAAYAAAAEEVGAAHAESERMVGELREKRERLQAYAAQAEALAGMAERNRLARELHDSVSQTLFTVRLLTSSARMLLDKDPIAVRPKLEQLQDLSQAALATMRGLITDLDGGPGRQ